VAHPYNSKRADKVGSQRAHKLVGGGHSDVVEDRGLIRNMVKSSALRRASGGRIKKPSVDININVGGGGGPPAIPLPPLPPSGLTPPPPPPMSGPGGPPPSGPPPMPMRARGGAVPGPGWTTSEKWRTPVQHSDGKNDGKDLGRGKPITYAKGGVAKGK